MKIILLLILAFFLISVVRIGIFIYTIRKKMKQMANDMRQQYYGQQAQGFGRQTSDEVRHTKEGVTVIDRRTPEDRDKKIFTHDEGEYVDFTEE